MVSQACALTHECLTKLLSHPSVFALIYIVGEDVCKKGGD